jgi:peptide/nickel transport system ATP-binding protein
MIALALANKPSLLIADEPTTALDVTIQAQILDLLRKLQREMGMIILFITHNLGVVAEIAQQVVVMYAGRVVEQAPVRDLFARPKHPYTEGLLASTPNAARDIAPDGTRRPLVPIPGSVPSITALPPGCTYAPRCRYAAPKCTTTVPPLFTVGPAHLSRCLRHELL